MKIAAGLIVFLLLAMPAGQSGATETEESAIGYDTVAAALKALKEEPGSIVSVQDGWTIIESTENGQWVLWSFTPSTNPAYPAVIKRQLIEEEGAISLGMTVLCEATKDPCDNLIAEFNTLNDQMVESVSTASATGSQPAKRASFIAGPEDEAAVVDRIRQLSVTYLTDVLGGEYEKAYAFKAPDSTDYQGFEAWLETAEELRAIAGPVLEINVHTITVYDNPPNAPTPGLYVAADYQNSLQNAPYHCGFLLWYRGESGDFQITREELGLISNEDLKVIPDGKLQEMLDYMKCSAP